MTQQNKTMLGTMLWLATNKHRAQFDKGGWPYILHTIRVMENVKAMYPDYDEEMLCAAVGHDLIEDTKTTIQELRNLGFSELVIGDILALTKQLGQEPDEYYQGIISRGARVIKIKRADITDNSDLSRIKGATQKDFDRAAEYGRRFTQLTAALAALEEKV